ncbi:DUF4919 domain-containing protein [Echinicola sp. CAU 1574]|uniref:DUF4919 domain-containing protein n=1 Tax=Echinicola arenosa TaxID=2774144 RepID=A0ABR9AIS9_9BACT|nr:DUF4919 domain-containing protein [Echinicola arenosa]MBD8488744.1 DUF4919 domain-containing protein [Echinicola arenosa]
MKKIGLFCMLSLMAHFAYPQYWEFEKPNYEQIRTHIIDDQSDFHFPNLMTRFLKADSTMSLEEKRHLYYGFVFHQDYSPYSIPKYKDSLETVLQKVEHNHTDLKKIIQHGDSILAENPFDLTVMNYQLYAHENLEDTSSFQAKIIQMEIVFDALLSSGDGASKKTAFYVIDTSHEYDLIDVLGFKFDGSQSLTEHFDYLKVANNDLGLEGMYFDISPCLNSLSKSYSKK